MSNGFMIVMVFALIILVPVFGVVIVLSMNKLRRKKKLASYTGVTRGQIMKIVDKGLDHPDVIYVSYSVDGVPYQIKESAKLKSETIKLGKLPVGQRKTYVLGPVTVGSFVKIQYDVNRPQKAIIADNNGLMTG